ncbi:MGMT family protein, partial [Agromyces binzhouensis]
MPRDGEGFVDAVLAVVSDIPPGTVMTYGDVAATLGSRGARAVGQVMARYGGDVPWWRVVRAG